MPKPAKFAIALLMVALAAVLPRPDWITVGIAAFGLFNLFAAVPGTHWVRGIAVAATLGALISNSGAAILALFAWLVWPPAFLMAWALGRDADRPAPGEARDEDTSGQRARVTLAAVIGAVAIASLAFRLIMGYGLHQSAALFVGTPALLASVVVLWVSPRSATGVACKAVTVGLLVSMVFLGEGMLCVAMSAPLFYLVAVLIGVTTDRARRFDARGRTIFSCVGVLVLAPMSLEGVTEFTSFNREETIVETRLVEAPAAMVAHAVLQPPRFDRRLPPFLRAAFPRPIDTWTEYHDEGMRLVVRMRGGETRLNGTEPKTGDLVLQVEDIRPGLVRWRAVADGSHMTHFLDWRESVVQWEAVSETTTRVTWTIRYRRGLDPAWYFGPWERYAARLSAAYLIDSVATP